MTKLAVAVSLVMAMSATEASACLPAIVSQAEATELEEGHRRDVERYVDTQFAAATDVVYAVVIDGAKAGGTARLRVIATYRGLLKPGATVRAKVLEDVHSTCGGTADLESAGRRGSYGVLAFAGRRPDLQFVGACSLELAFRRGHIVRRRSPTGDVDPCRNSFRGNWVVDERPSGKP